MSRSTMKRARRNRQGETDRVCLPLPPLPHAKARRYSVWLCASWPPPPPPPWIKREVASTRRSFEEMTRRVKTDFDEGARVLGIHPQGLDFAIRMTLQRLPPSLCRSLLPQETTSLSSHGKGERIRQAVIDPRTYNLYLDYLALFLTLWRAIVGLGYDGDAVAMGEAYDADVEQLMRMGGLSYQEADVLAGTARRPEIRRRLGDLRRRVASETERERFSDSA